MDTNETIRALNKIAEPHYSNGGHFIGTGDEYENCIARAANEARWAMADHIGLDTRVCYMRRAQIEAGRAYAIDTCPADDDRREFLANAITWAECLICEAIRELTAPRKRTRRAASAAR